MVSDNEVRASLYLNSIDTLGPLHVQRLITHFGSAEKIVEAGCDAWMAALSKERDWTDTIRRSLDSAKRESDFDWDQIKKREIRVYLAHTGPYPQLLKELSVVPPIIYVAGMDLMEPSPAVAIVGSRRSSYYGEKVVRRLVEGLAANGVITVSGLARGIDTHVHRETLKAGGKTWAVIGSGLSKIYPPENKSLAESIESAGAVLSEFPMRTTPFPGNFPRRNRIIAGISLGTVVVEGGAKSGALITARLAAEEGRDVMAVPGPITSELSVAPHRMLRHGAALVESADDILMELGLSKNAAATFDNDKSAGGIDALQSKILEILGSIPMLKEVLIEKLGGEPSTISSVLLEMEINGFVKTIAGGFVLRA